jgi:sec-independent protein translocase protein TatA
MSSTLAFISMPGGGEWLIIGMIGLLLFGKRLPEVGHSLGRTIIEFKKGLAGIEQEIERASHEPPPAERPRLTEAPEATIPTSPATVEMHQAEPASQSQAA